MQYRNAKYIDENHTFIECEVKIDGDDWIPYSLTEDSNSALWKQMYKDNNIADFVFDIALARANKIDLLRSEYVERMNKIFEIYSQPERDTWPMKRDSAHAYKAGTASELHTKALSLYADSKGLSVDDYVNLILEKVENFMTISAAHEKARQQAIVQVGSALTQLEIDAIVPQWPSI